MIKDVPMPVVAEGDVLVRVMTTAVNIGDARLRALRVPRGLSIPTRLAMGILRPRNPVLGLEVAGIVEQVGAAVRSFKPGDRVVASRGFKFGGHAEFMAVPETGSIAGIPAGVSDADAVALLFGGVTALIFFDKGKLQAGEHILVNGASGAVGVMAVQIAKQRGAEVTGVCSACQRRPGPLPSAPIMSSTTPPGISRRTPHATTSSWTMLAMHPMRGSGTCSSQAGAS